MENELIDFLLKAKKATYAADGAVQESSRSSSYDLSFSEGDYRYLDSYFGTHLFSGQEVVWKREEPIWAMNYSGRVLSENFNSKFLKEALQHPTKEIPYRGKNFYQKEEYTYLFEITGDFSWFKGQERIFFKDELVYELELHGGYILDKKFD